MTANRLQHPGPFYHGTRADLASGDLITHCFISNDGAGKPTSWLHMAGTIEAAIWGAERAAGPGRERVSINAPIGLVEE